jgi:hypothetical protein
VQKYASLYAFQDFLIQQQRRALDGLSTAIGILTMSEDNDPRNAPRADIARFRDQVVSLRSILFIEEQLAAGVTARYKKALE